MYLKQLKEKFESLPPNEITSLGLSEPFSWRGVYAEVAFTLIPNMTVEESLVNIEKAYGTFEGWKGGDFTYDDYTDVNFENDWGDWSDGDYAKSKIKELNTDDFMYDLLLESL